jgi:ferredoxin
VTRPDHDSSLIDVRRHEVGNSRQAASVTIEPDGITARATSADTVLAALGRAGLRYRVGCRRGGCGICKVQLIVGEVRYERPIAASVLTSDERAAGICLSCRAVPITNIVIELQEGDRLRKVLGFAFPRTTSAAGRADDQSSNRKEMQP